MLNVQFKEKKKKKITADRDFYGFLDFLDSQSEVLDLGAQPLSFVVIQQCKFQVTHVV